MNQTHSDLIEKRLSDFEGTDVSLTISLINCGMLWKYLGDGSYLIIYGTGTVLTEENETVYNRFNWGIYALDDLFDEAGEDFYDNIGKLEGSELTIEDLPLLVSFEGVKNVFGYSNEQLRLKQLLYSLERG